MKAKRRVTTTFSSSRKKERFMARFRGECSHRILHSNQHSPLRFPFCFASLLSLAALHPYFVSSGLHRKRFFVVPTDYSEDGYFLPWKRAQTKRKPRFSAGLSGVIRWATCGLGSLTMLLCPEIVGFANEYGGTQPAVTLNRHFFQKPYKIVKNKEFLA